MSRHVSRSLKFLHTIGSVGVLGSLGCLIALIWATPGDAELRSYAHTRIAMGQIADYIFMPSLCITLVAGLFAIAANRVFQNA